MAEKAKIVQKRRIRAGHRSSATKLLNRVKENLGDGTEAVDKHWIKQSIQAMREKVDSLKGLDNQIIELIGALEEGVEALIEKEIEESDEVRKELNQIVLRMEEVLSKTNSPPALNQVPVQETPPPVAVMPQQHTVKARLPKLEVKKFNGRIQEWQEFWDAFESPILKNDGLSAVDKFSYLRSLVQEPARSSIAGFALTGANYEEAFQVLKKRYGKGTAIQQAQVNDLLSLPPVYSDRDTPRLGRLYDRCETHHRGLIALGVNETTYA